MYLDFTFCFFLIKIPLLIGNEVTEPSSLRSGHTQRTSIARHMSPFLLNLNLNPLYSKRGGSITRADPFIKYPIVVDRRSNPL